MKPRELQHFLLLPVEQQEQAIQRLMASGMSENTIGSITGLSVEMVRRILAKHQEVRA